MPFFSWTEVLFNHAVKLHDYWFVQELHEPMATIRANIPAETGGASGYISGRFAIGSSDFFSFSDDDFVYADPEKPTRRWHASQ